MVKDVTSVATSSYRDGTVDVGGRQIAYAEYGSPDGAPVLFFHGTPGSRHLASILDDQATDARIRLLAPERPGLGRSGPAKRYGLLDWSRDVAHLVDALNLDSIGVVGFSGGGPHALAVGAGIEKGQLSMNKLSGIGLLAGSGPPETPQGNTNRSVRAMGVAVRSFPRIANGLFKLGAWIARRRSPTATVGLYSNRPVGEDQEITPDIARMIHQDYCEAFQQGSEHAVRDSKRVLSEWAFDPTAIDIPIAGWYGGADRNVSPAHGEYLAKQIPHADISVEDDLDHLGVLVECGPTAIRWVAP